VARAGPLDHVERIQAADVGEGGGALDGVGVEAGDPGAVGERDVAQAVHVCLFFTFALCFLCSYAARTRAASSSARSTRASERTGSAPFQRAVASRITSASSATAA